jgi:hypothetical protein
MPHLQALWRENRCGVFPRAAPFDYAQGRQLGAVRRRAQREIGGPMDDPDHPPSQSLSIDSAHHSHSAGNLTLWVTYSFASDWLSDAKSEAATPLSAASRRREVLFAVCFAESYLYEWVRDRVLERDFARLAGFFPTGIAGGFGIGGRRSQGSLRPRVLSLARPTLADPHGRISDGLWTTGMASFTPSPVAPNRQPCQRRSSPSPREQPLKRSHAAGRPRLCNGLFRSCTKPPVPIRPTGSPWPEGCPPPNNSLEPRPKCRRPKPGTRTAAENCD